jgi:hypothetical protein
MCVCVCVAGGGGVIAVRTHVFLRLNIETAAAAAVHRACTRAPQIQDQGDPAEARRGLQAPRGGDPRGGGTGGHRVGVWGFTPAHPTRIIVSGG